MEIKKKGDIMKFKSYLMNLSLLSAAVLVMSGCTDDEFKQNNNIPKGNGIVFGANASYNGGPQTRTEYGDYVTGADGKKSQEIKWLSTDKVDIYSPSSPSLKKVEYGITNVDENQKNQAYLWALGDGLQWDRTSSTQSFYAIYPSKESMSNEAVKNVVSFENGVLKGYIPVNQQHTITKDDKGAWIAKPNMDYLYMAAVQKDYTIPAADANDGVSLHFVPLTTTLELTIEGPTEAPIASINVFANDGDNIAGYFSCDLTAANTTNIDNSNLNCIYESSATVRNMITISGYYDDGGTQKPLELASGESITFNVFLLPHTDLDNISVRIAGFNTASKTMSLAGVTLHPSQKTCVKLKAPQIAKDGKNNWITGMEDKVLISQLSIPGTANSFSYNYNKEDGSDQYYKTQTALFEQQWNAGIRCFELRCPNSDDNSLDGVQLQCNRENLGITFGQAVDMIWEKVKNTREFAMIMPTFESNAGRDWRVTDFANDLNQFFTDHSDYKYVTYGRELTVGDARGSLMFIARITSEEDGELELPTPGQGVFIDQWGSLKDNWARRGYPVDNWANKNDWWTQAMEGAIMHRENIDYVPTTIPVKGAVNYIHNTTRAGGTPGTAYIQDWARVVKESKNYELYTHYYLYWGQWTKDYTQYVYWNESLTEKQNDIWNTFKLAIEDNNNQQGSTFYINCLDGYFVDAAVPLSYNPYIEGYSENYHPDYVDIGGIDFNYGNGGVAGNIDAFANDINNWFYNEILKYGTSNIYGPMNIVILDRVYEDGGGSYLPSVIINNNYRFPLITIDDVQGQTNSDASYTSGGNVIE